MLELLPTRGPTAFDTFLSILEKDYPWLQKGLQEDLDKELAEQRQHGMNSVLLGYCVPLHVIKSVC